LKSLLTNVLHKTLGHLKQPRGTRLLDSLAL